MSLLFWLHLQHNMTKDAPLNNFPPHSQMNLKWLSHLARRTNESLLGAKPMALCIFSSSSFHTTLWCYERKFREWELSLLFSASRPQLVVVGPPASTTHANTHTHTPSRCVELSFGFFVVVRAHGKEGPHFLAHLNALTHWRPLESDSVSPVVANKRQMVHKHTYAARFPCFNNRFESCA